MAEKHIYGSLPLGKKVDYPDQYDPSSLQPIAREIGRRRLAADLPMWGEDLWNAYELSWLDEQGKPQVACARFRFPASSPNMVESKSFKLYLNSFNQTRIGSAEKVSAALARDLTEVAGADVEVDLIMPGEWHNQLALQEPKGQCLDDLPVPKVLEKPSMEVLALSGEQGEQCYYSNLLRSRCPVTGQPDWATVEIELKGDLPDPAALLGYLVSYRNHDEFHEQCVERIFSDLYQVAKPERLSVYACYTRRGGLDINPFRSTAQEQKMFSRLARQ